MAMVDIQSLFADIIESPRQRQQAMSAQGAQEAAAVTNNLTGGARLAAPLLAQLAMSAGKREEGLRQSVGGLFGIDTRTPSQQLQEVLSQAQTPEQQAQLPNTLRQMGYGQQAMALEQQLAEQQRVAAAAAAQQAQQAQQSQLEALRFQLDVEKFGEERATQQQERRIREQEEARAAGTYDTTIQDQERGRRELEAFRASAIEIINTAPIPANMIAGLSRAANAGLFDENREELFKLAYGNDEIVTFGGVAYNASAARRGETNTWLAAPKTPTNLAEEILSRVDPSKYTPESVAQALTLFNQATTPDEQNLALSVLQGASSENPGDAIKVIGTNLAMDVNAYNTWVRGGKQGEQDFWIKSPTAAGSAPDAYSGIVEDLNWGNYTPASIATWLAAQDDAITLEEKAATINLLQPVRSGAASAALSPAILKAEEEATASSSQAGRMLSLSTQFDDAMKAGSGARMGAFIERLTGTSSDAAAARLEYNAIRNVFVLASLPPGTASDVDVALAMGTTPDDFAAPAQINSWLRGQAKMAAMAAEYNLFKADYLNKNQNAAGLARAWETQRAAPGYKEEIENKYGFKFNPDADREAILEAAKQGRN
jgi:hypothetical protein